MTSVNKEAPVTDDVASTPSQKRPNKGEFTTTTMAMLTKINAATPVDGVK